MVLMEEMTSREFDLYRDENTVVMLPIGALEEHGDHLPLSTDTYQPVHIVQGVVKKLEIMKKQDVVKKQEIMKKQDVVKKQEIMKKLEVKNNQEGGKVDGGQDQEKGNEAVKVIVAPTLGYGMIQSTLKFPGSITLSFDTLRSLIFEVLKGFGDNDLRNIVVISGHAGRSHMMAIRLAAHELLKLEGYDHLKIIVLSDYDIAYDQLGKEFPSTDGHGGELETSRILAIRPDLVKGKGVPTELVLPPYRIVANPQDHFPSGIWGDPTPATAEKGKMVNDRIVNELSQLIVDMVQED